jgi:hypothetical protein
MADLAGSVRELLMGDALERAEEIIASLMGSGLPPAPAFSGTVSGRYLDDLLSRAPNPTEAARVGIEFLTRATSFGGVNDPTQEGSEVPWLRLVEHVLPLDLEHAAVVAREWSRCLFELGFGSDQDVLNRPLVQNILGVIEALLGRDVRAEYHLEAAQVESEVESESGTVTFLRAVRIVRGALRAREPL